MKAPRWRCGTLLLAAAAGLARAQCPLPRDLAIVPPAPTVPAMAARFSGAWGPGAWDGSLQTFLVVEAVRDDRTASIIYSYGQGPGAAAQWRRLPATFVDGHLHCQLADQVTLDFWLNEDAALFGRYTARGRPASVELPPVRSADLSAIRQAAAQPAAPPWTEIEIPEPASAAGRGGLRLQATLYRQPGPGRHPLVIFNHGSTGPGIIPASLVDRGWTAALVFRSLGYSVVVPMRRGRGRSEGALIEESDPSPAVQLAAAMEDLDAVAAYMRRQPYVDPSHIVLSGQSRGGFLAIVYAGRHPRDFAGVVEFAGGWFGERTAEAAFNTEEYRKAGRAGGPPMLWLCAQHDSFYSPAYVGSQFTGFKAAGGKGELLTFDGVPGNGHFLISWPEKWCQPVAAFLKAIH